MHRGLSRSLDRGVVGTLTPWLGLALRSAHSPLTGSWLFAEMVRARADIGHIFHSNRRMNSVQLSVWVDCRFQHRCPALREEVHWILSRGHAGLFLLDFHILSVCSLLLFSVTPPWWARPCECKLIPPCRALYIMIAISQKAYKIRFQFPTKTAGKIAVDNATVAAFMEDFILLPSFLAELCSTACAV